MTTTSLLIAEAQCVLTISTWIGQQPDSGIRGKSWSRSRGCQSDSGLLTIFDAEVQDVQAHVLMYELNGSQDQLLLVGNAESFKVGPRFLKIVVDDDLVKDTWLLGKIEFILCLCEALSDGVLGVGGTAAKALLQDLN